MTKESKKSGKAIDKKSKSNGKIAVILIRGLVNLSPDVRRTLDLLRLKRKFSSVVIDDNKVNRGMLNRVKDYVTYGEIDKELFKKMLEKRGRTKGNNSIDKKVVGEIAEKYFSNEIKLIDFIDYDVKPFFRLHPPIKGFERGGIKKPYSVGGVLGYRGKAMIELIEKML